jgi:hypothetical protein
VYEYFQTIAEKPNESNSNSKITQIDRQKNLSKSKVSPEVVFVVEVPMNTTDNKRNSGINPETIDRISSVAYALLFIAFNIYYWSFFLSEADKK